MTDGENVKHQILRSTSIIGGATLAGLVIGLIKMKLIALVVGPVGVGLLGTLTAILTMGYSIAGMGLDSTAVRQLSAAGTDANRIRICKWGVWTFALSLAVAGLFLVWLFRAPLSELATGSDTYAGDVGWLAVGVALSIVAAVPIAQVQAQRRMLDFARIRVWAALGAALIGIASVYAFGIGGVVAAVLAVPISTLGAALWFGALRKAGRLGRFPGKVVFAEWKVLGAMGLAIMASAAVGSATQAAVRGILIDDLGLGAAGLFQASFAISALNFALLLGAMVPEYYPRLSAAVDDRRAMEDLLNQQLHVAIILTGPALIAISTLAPFLLTLLYTSEFADAAPLLRLQLVADSLRLAGWALGFVLLALRRSVIYFFLEVVITILFLPLTWFGAAALGIEAAGGAYAIACAISLLVSATTVRRLQVRISLGNVVLVGALALFLLVIACASVVGEAAAIGIGAAGLAGASYYTFREIRRIGLPLPEFRLGLGRRRR